MFAIPSSKGSISTGRRSHSDRNFLHSVEDAGQIMCLLLLTQKQPTRTIRKGLRSSDWPGKYVHQKWVTDRTEVHVKC